MQNLNAVAAIPITDRRSRDRRHGKLRHLFLGAVAKGRRRAPRRESDHHSYYVDWYEPKLLAVVIGIFVLNCLDAMFTLTLLSKGGEEINIFMAALLENGISTFVNVKLGITALALVFLVVHSAFRLVGSIRVRHLLYGVFGNYVALLCYEITLFSRAF